MARIEIDLFYDYNCPFVYRAAHMLRAVDASGERDVKVRWRYFSLTQVNHHPETGDEGWTVWGAQPQQPVKGRLAFRAAEAARRQGGFEAFHAELLQARHRDRADIEDEAVVGRVASESGLDLPRWKADLAGPDILDALARDHQQGLELYGMFGTPTFVFEGGRAAYVRLAHLLDGADALRVFDRLVDVAGEEPEILEIKRPVRIAS